MRYIVFLFIIFISEKGITQNGISLNFNSCYTGKNVSLLYSKQFSRHIASLGFKYHINTEPGISDNYNILYQRYYAFNPGQHFGLMGQYEYVIFPKIWIFNVSAFYNIQFTRAGLRSMRAPYIIEDYKVNNNIEQNVGVCLSVPIKDKIIIKAMAGIGAALIWDLDDRFPEGYFNESLWNVAHIFSIGVGYLF